MKRILSAALALCLLLSTLSLVGCGASSKKENGLDSGTEAARLLLANERLDERLVQAGINVGLSAADTYLAGQRRGIGYGVLSGYLSGTGDSSATRGHVWSDFPANSESTIELTQFIDSIEHEVERVASDIAHMKTNVGVTDKWVRVGVELQMLRVFESTDVLLVLGMYGDIHVYYRYTDENAKNSYEMFSLMSYDDGTTGEIRTLFVPNERYEYMYRNSGGFNDYFIADNSRGYWVNTRFGYDDASNASFYPYIVKDGIGIGPALVLSKDGGIGSAASAETLKQTWYSIFDPTSNRELIRLHTNGSEYSFDLYFSAIKSGFVSVSASSDQLYVRDGIYMANDLSSLVTQKGTYTVHDPTLPAPKDDFIFRTGTVRYNYGDELHPGSYSGYATFVISSEDLTPEQACEKFLSYVVSIGLTLYCTADVLSASVEHATLFSDSFGESFTWNGHRIDSFRSLTKATEALCAQYDRARADYEAVKDYEIVEKTKTLSSSAHFAALAVQTDSGNRFEGGTVKILDLSVLTDDLALFEEGEEYVLKIGLSLVDENGKPISVNTVALKGSESETVRFDGGPVAFTLSGEYELPSALDAGSYAAVVYIATKADGIRVSELCKLAFLEIEQGQIESSQMQIEALSKDGTLIVKYDVLHTRTVVQTATKQAYSYEEIRRAIMLEILSHGAPSHGAMLEHEDGGEISQSETLGRGVYRMACYLATDEGLVQSYVYLELK